MAAITATALNISPLPGAMSRPVEAGASGNVGDVVYIDANGKAQAADSDAAGTARGRGIVVSAGTEGKTTFVSGDKLSVVMLGPVEGFTGMTPGNVHYVSGTTGKLDTVAGTTSHIMGWALSATVFFVSPQLA